MPGRGRPTRKGYQERGATRSGLQFARLNSPYQPTLRLLLDRHRSLLDWGPVSAQQLFSVGSSSGTLVQTTIRFRADQTNISEGLREKFLELFRVRAERSSGSGSRTDCFEVVVTFNVVLSNREGNTFSVFFGQDYSPGSSSGTSNKLNFFDRNYIVRELADVQAIPTTFDLDEVAEKQRIHFEDSDVKIVRVLNVVYLVYQFISGKIQPPRDDEDRRPGRRTYRRRRKVRGQERD
jgi:hypothetical protein